MGDNLRELLDRLGQSQAKLVDGKLPGIAGAGSVQNPVANPLGGPTIAGTTITVDMLVNPPTIIPETIRALVASNQGYFIERVFNTPGFTVQGGAIIYTESFPTDHFLPAD